MILRIELYLSHYSFIMCGVRVPLHTGCTRTSTSTTKMSSSASATTAAPTPVHAAAAQGDEGPRENILRGFWIASINPRLVVYNRPLLLAVLIGLTTVASTGAMFVFLMSSCSTTRDKQAYTQPGVKSEHVVQFADALAEAGVQDNVETKINICLMGARTLDTFSHSAITPPVGGGWVPGVVAYVPCGVSDGLLAELGIGWCSSSHRQSAISACTDAGVNCRQCGDPVAGVQNMPVSDFPFAVLARTTTVRTTCPVAWTAVGVALGYAAYFEIVVTLLLVILLRMAGVVTMPHGQVGGIMQLKRLADSASLGNQARAGCFHANRLDAASSV